MIYLSANGEVLGQFEETAVPRMLSEGKISSGAFFWREGMAEWRPVTELAEAAQPQAKTKPILPKLVAAPVAAQAASTPQVSTPKPAETPAPVAKPAAVAAKPVATKPIVASPVPMTIKQPAVAASATATAPTPRKIFLPRKSGVQEAATPPKSAEPQPQPAAPAAGDVVEEVEAAEDVATGGSPTPVARKPFVPRRAPAAKPSGPEGAQPFRSVAEAVPVAAQGGKGKSWLVWLSVLLLLLAGAGGGAWWWLNRAPAAIPGRVSLSGDGSGPVEIHVFRREELAAPWRERLSAAEARGAELEKLVAEAQAVHREKVILYDEAAGVCAAGEEYNMPDVEELRADRDAKKVEADAAKAELDKLQAEKETLLTFESLLAAVPAPLQTIVADPQGNFLLPPPEAGDVVLLATASSASDGQGASQAWLEVLETSADGAWPEAVQFSETNRLDVDEIRRFAGATP
jgi:hypothetical protein